MAISTYSELQDSIKRWIDRDDLSGQIADAIALHEGWLNSNLRVAQMEASATITLTSGAGTLPTDYLQWRRVRSNASPVRDLEYAEPSWIAEHYPDTASELADYFTIIGSTISTAPPSTADILLDYYQKIPALADNTSGNWLLSRAPGVYLWGTCLQLAPFIDDDARIGTWGKLLDREVQALQGSDVLARYGRSVARTRGVTP